MLTHSLAGSSWQFRNATKRDSWHPATVPGCVHKDLRAIDAIPDPFFGTNELDLQWIEEAAWEYTTTFEVSADILNEKIIELVADGLDTVVTVSLNGTAIGRGENMFIRHRWNIRPQLQPGPNTLLVRFDSAMDYIRTHRLGHDVQEFNDCVGRCQVIRKEQCQFGWDWGPRFVTAGIWQDLRLEAWSGNRLRHVHVAQDHTTEGVHLTFTPQLARRDARATCRGEIRLGGELVSTFSGSEVHLPEPELWWPVDHGAQPLYEVTLHVTTGSGQTLVPWTRRIGLRTIELDRHADEWGESFQFKVNGRVIFAKGANWIPAHSFVAGLTRADYARDLSSAAAAHLNMIRVWGGGIYESEHFYDLCDELGLLVWQDFMFACSLYPADAAFVASVKVEATQAVRRLQHRACLALWCGNNEITQLNIAALEKPAARRAYERVFHEALPAVVAAEDGSTDYWPASQWRGDFESSDQGTPHPLGEQRGDTHFWDVWHSRKPVKDYEKWKLRFVSEFGMQSYSSPETNATFCPPGKGNAFGSIMENHQKNRGGNQVILDYISRRYRFPQSQDALIYLSQLNQAYCMQVGVEHYRRNMPRCMGALYWQLNDCWPVASWSSIEFTGRWKALHHLARRFFAPALVSAHVPGDESSIIGNYRRSTVDQVDIYTVYDAPEPATGNLRWDICTFAGTTLEMGRQDVALTPGKSTRQQQLELKALIAEYSRDELYVRIALDVPGHARSEETVFLASPRFLSLPRGRTRVTCRRFGPQSFRLNFVSTVFQHRFVFDLPGMEFSASDNYFELYPKEAKAVELTFAGPVDRETILDRLTHHSLVDTY